MSEFPVTAYTSNGWPLVTPDDYIRVIPTALAELAAKLDNSDADVAAAINAATQAQTAASTVIGQGTIVTARGSSDWTAVAGQNVPWAALTLTDVTPDQRWAVEACLDCTLSSGVIAIDLTVDGTDVDLPQLITQVSRATTSRRWWLDGMTAGSHTLRLRAAVVSGTVNGTHSTFTAERIR